MWKDFDKAESCVLLYCWRTTERDQTARGARVVARGVVSSHNGVRAAPLLALFLVDIPSSSRAPNNQNAKKKMIDK